jgi:hypothetical protein
MGEANGVGLVHVFGKGVVVELGIEQLYAGQVGLPQLGKFRFGGHRNF